MFRIKKLIAFFCMLIVGSLQALLVEDAPTKIPYHRIFEYGLGMSEHTFKLYLSTGLDPYGAVTPVYLSRKNDLYFLEKKGYQTVQAGCFEQLTLADLKSCSSKQQSKGTFNVLEGPNNADIRKLQADKKFNGATFQVASNFNALETVGPEQDIEQQLLSDYVFDATQGPAAALGAAAGLMQRRYELFNNLNNGESVPFSGASLFGQRPCQKYGLGERQVNLIHCICNEQTGIEMSPAGYVRLNNAIKDSSPLECDDFLQIKIGCQRATQVVFGAIDGHPSDSNTMIEVVPSWISCMPCYLNKQIINQVFVAAPDFGQGTNKRSPRADAWAKTILRAEYEGTLRMAHRCGSKDVILTWVGGGAFNNDPVWVVEILENLEPLIKSLGLNVYLAAYGFTPGQAKYRGRLEDLVAKTGGSWVK